jgi:hypothetical protein
MPGVPSSLVTTVKTLIQKSFQTNTAKEMIDDSVSIFVNRNKQYHIARLSTTVIMGGGCAALFVVEPTVSSYFVPIVEQTLPFLGTVATKVAIGVVGYWLGGALGSCSVKAIEKEITFQKEGFRNPRLKFTEDDLKRLVKHNPQFFPPTDAEPSSENIEALRRMLEQARDQIETFREKQKLDDKRKYKKALLEAIYKGNLSPLAEVIASIIAEQETSNRITVQTVQYMANVPDDFFLSSQIPDEARRTGNPQAYIEAQSNHQEGAGLLSSSSTEEPTENKSSDQIKLKKGPIPYHQPRTLRFHHYPKDLGEAERQKLEEERQRTLLFLHQREHASNLRSQAQAWGSLPQGLLSVLPISGQVMTTRSKLTT